MVRIYEFKITWDKVLTPSSKFTILQISQKTLMTSKGTGTLRFLKDDRNKICGSQVLIDQNWYDTPTMNKNIMFKGDFTQSYF